MTTPAPQRRRAGHRQPAAPTNLTYLRIVESVTARALTQQQLAAAVGASVRSVQIWAQGDATPSGVRARRLLDVRHLVDELSEVYTDEGVPIWLNSRNRNLDHQRPIDLLAEGRYEEVLTEARHLSGGMG